MAASTERVERNTREDINRQIEQGIRASVFHHQAHPDQLNARLRELNKEWDVERTLEANASTLAFIGVVLGAAINPWFLLIPAIVTAFLFQHAVQGWCPPLPILRRLGFRTAKEIRQEYYALKAARGDFDQVVNNPNRADAALRAVGVGEEGLA